MSWYELLLFGHITAVTLWLGSGLFLQILAVRAERARDAEGLRRLMSDAAALGETFFLPSSVAVLVFGVLLTIDGPWSLDQLWLVLGLVGYAATFLTGLFVMKPGGERLDALAQSDGPLAPRTLLETRKLLIKARVDAIVLYLVLADMALKPTGEDVALLAAMAAIVVVGLGWVVARLRAVDAEAAAGPAVAAS